MSVIFRFADFFAGIGGFRIGLEKVGGKCVFSSEWDRYAQQTYESWFGERPQGDIRLIARKPEALPQFDVLAAGFPCQPFSIAGVSKRASLGMAHGFECRTQGNLFFELCKIIRAKRPRALFLENVKNLKSHDRGRTWGTIHKELNDLGYWVFDRLIDAAGWVPQHRERIYIVCFDKTEFRKRPRFEFPEPEGPRPRLADILDSAAEPKYTLSERLWNYLQAYAQKHRAKGNGFGFGLIDPEGISRTLSARYYKDGSEILVPQPSKPPRRLTPRECARLMGFEDRTHRRAQAVSDTQAYRQFGNAVSPKIVEAVGARMVRVLQTEGVRRLSRIA